MCLLTNASLNGEDSRIRSGRGGITVPGGILEDLLAVLPADTATLSCAFDTDPDSEDSKLRRSPALKIECGNVRATVKGLDAERLED